MAGIGFDLKKIFYSESTLGKAKVTLQSFFVSSGPWVISVFTIASLKLINNSLMTKQSFNSFIGILIYSFVFSLIISSSLTNILTRHVSDLLYEEKFSEVISAFLTGFLLIGSVSFLISYYYIHKFTSLQVYTLKICYMFTSLNILWFVMIFVSMLKDAKKVTISFLIGMVLIILLNIFYSKGNLGKSIDSFTTGICFTVFYLTALIVAQFDFNNKLDFSWLKKVKYYPLVLSGFFLYSGMWIDKIIYWFFSDKKFELAKGFYFFPQYDFAIFLAYLTIIPTTAYFVVFIETEFYEKQREYLYILENEGILENIRKKEEALLTGFYRSILNVIYFQTAIAIIFILTISPILEYFNIVVDSIPILRISTLDASLQMVFNVLIIFLYYFDYQKESVLATFIFFISNFILSWIMRNFPYPFTGYSYFISLIIANIFAYLVAKHKLLNPTYYLLMKNV